MINDNSLETIMVLIQQLEAALLGLKQIRVYVAQGVEQEMLDSVIAQNETRLVEIKRRVMQ